MGNGEYPHIKWLIFTLLYNSSRARASQGLCLIASKNINPASDYSGKCPETRDWTQQPVHIEHESHFCSRESHGPLRLGCVWEGDNDGYILVLYWVLCPAMSLDNFHGSVHRNRWDSLSLLSPHTRKNLWCDHSSWSSAAVAILLRRPLWSCVNMNFIIKNGAKTA